MPIIRNPDGIPEDIPTTRVSDKPTETTSSNSSLNIKVNLNSAPPGDAPTVIASDDSTDLDGPTVQENASQSRMGAVAGSSSTPSTAPRVGNRLTDNPTVIFGKSDRNIDTEETKPTTPVVAQNAPPASDGKTFIAGRGTNTHSAFAEPPPSTIPSYSGVRANPSMQNDPMSDPVAGWLVIVDGPGKGNVLNIGLGQNSIGRSETARITINFGDMEISRDNHAVVIYDPKSRKFFLQPGTGTNLIYLDEQEIPVLQPQILEAFSHISLGNSRLRFVPLCGADFNWESPLKD